MNFNLRVDLEAKEPCVRKSIVIRTWTRARDEFNGGNGTFSELDGEQGVVTA